MSDKMKNFIVRTMSGIALLAVLLVGLSGSPWCFGALMLAILAGGMIEFYRLAALCGAAPQRVIGLAMGAALFLCAFFCFSLVAPLPGISPYLAGAAVVFGLSFLLALVFLCFVCELFLGRRNPVANIGATFAGVLYAALPAALLPYLSFFMTGGWMPRVILFFIFIIWANDVFAYLAGMTLGRHKLCERISPKKTWEGFFGGVAGAVAMGAVAASVLEMSAVLWCGLAVVASVTGVLGDLVESMFKRAAGVKDSGTVIPGHGGVLDRFDALLLAAPFGFIYLLIYYVLFN